MADVQTSEVDVNLNQTTWDYEIVYAREFPKDAQLLLRPFLRKPKNMNVDDR
jgi:hypothetical protein